MDAFAYDYDVEAIWGPLTILESSVVPGLLREASVKLRLRVPDVDTRIVGDELRAEAAKIAVVNAVKRVLMNPEAVRQYSSTSGPYTDSKTIDAAVSSGFVYISNEDLVGLTPKRSKPRMKSFRIRSGYL